MTRRHSKSNPPKIVLIQDPDQGLSYPRITASNHPPDIEDVFAFGGPWYAKILHGRLPKEIPTEASQPIDPPGTGIPYVSVSYSGQCNPRPFLSKLFLAVSSIFKPR